MTQDPIRVGILETGRLPDELATNYGDYVEMVGNWLNLPDVTPRGYAVVDMELPARPEDADIWLITGSRHGAYEDHPWIPPLEQFIRDCRAAGVPMVGICFGHQIMAQALGGKVAKSAKGWGVGVHEYSIDNWPAELGDTPADLRLHAFHQDQVEELPDGAQVLASSPFCDYAALWYPGFAVTFQGHPEYKPDFASDLLTIRTGTVIDPDTARAGQARIADPTSSQDMAARVRDWVLTRKKGTAA